MRCVIVCGTDVGQSKDTVRSHGILTFEAAALAWVLHITMSLYVSLNLLLPRSY